MNIIMMIFIAVIAGLILGGIYTWIVYKIEEKYANSYTNMMVEEYQKYQQYFEGMQR